MNAPLPKLDEETARDPKLADHVYERIFELIVIGEFPEHARLPAETELSRRFGASRPVIRSALARLRDDGIIVSRQGSGSYVRRRPDNAVLRFVPVSSIADIQRCFEFRAALEGAAAALAAERREKDDLAKIRQALDELDDCIRTGRLGVEADERFHLAVAEATHNHFHVSVQRSLQPHIAFGMNLARNLSLLRPDTRLQIVQAEHVAIVEAIERQDSRAARLAMETHIDSARHRVFEGKSREE